MWENEIFVNDVANHSCENSLIPMRPLPILILAATLASSIAAADDGAASIAAGGIVMKREPRITMAKEVLFISPSLVKVDYDFRNDTDADITTEVAFPVPAYEIVSDLHSIANIGFGDFRLTVSGVPKKYDVETKAFLKGRDVSSILTKSHIDIASFGHLDQDQHVAADFERLSASKRKELVRAGLLSPDWDGGLWSVKKNYYWQQTFPAHATIHIAHTYTPVLGLTNSVSYGLLPSKEDPDSAKEIASLCIDPTLRQKLLGYLKEQNTIVPFSYVDFILTTANTWKTPIEDFTLIVERPHNFQPKFFSSQQTFVSFCWDGQVAQTDPDHFTTHITNLVPKKELRVGFIDVEHLKP
jgi:hypothetical protein